MGKIICGIQQMGVGVPDMREAWKWYREHFGMDIRVFEEEAIADLMLPYTDGKPRKRRAALAMNMHGGGGFEIWQHIDKTPVGPDFKLKYGDLGIFITKIKTRDVQASFLHVSESGVKLLGEVSNDPAGKPHFFVEDPYGNIFEFVGDSNIYLNHRGPNQSNGGVYGAVIGVSDFERSKELYCDLLGYSDVIYDEEGVFEDLACLPGGGETVRRVLLRHPEVRRGPFSKLLGPSQIELVRVKSRTPKKIYDGRIWGDLGFIHLCFDIQRMNDLRSECAEKGYPFTVDSADSFDMGVAAGHFAYIEDPDGTLIEFVETHKVPILKKFGLYMNLKNRDPEKALPNWMVNTLTFGRVGRGDL
jgi:catechol 2,3-dioxygenase-like lactoylglutathione lyase family enzyme